MCGVRESELSHLQADPRRAVKKVGVEEVVQVLPQAYGAQGAEEVRQANPKFESRNSKQIQMTEI
jgi:hypothetical protein